MKIKIPGFPPENSTSTNFFAGNHSSQTRIVFATNYDIKSVVYDAETFQHVPRKDEIVMINNVSYIVKCVTYVLNQNIVVVFIQKI